MTMGVVWATFPTSSSICIIFLILAYDRINMKHTVWLEHHGEFCLVLAAHCKNGRAASGPGIPQSFKYMEQFTNREEFHVFSLATLYETNI